MQLLVHVSRGEDGVRRVQSVSEVTGLEGETPLLQELFCWQRTGRSERHIEGRFTATGIQPGIGERLRSRGAELPPQLFQPSGAAPTSSFDGEDA